MASRSPRRKEKQMTNSPVLASLARPNRSFTREDLRKKENRINLELFGAHGIPEFWEPLCKLLGIPQGAWLTREVVAGTGDRPDSILKGVGLTDGCIEVELDRPDEQQLGRYSKRYSPVISIVGRRRGGLREHASLEEVVGLARSVAKKLGDTNRPAVAVLDHLADAIDDALNGSRGHASVQPIPTHMRDLPWLKTVVEPLFRLERAGYVTNRTTSSLSLSLQLERVPCMKGKRLALLTQRDPAVVYLPEPGEMARVLGGAMAEVTAAWDGLFQFVMPQWRIHRDGNKRVRMEIKAFEQNAEAVARVFCLLAELILLPDTGETSSSSTA
jgi:hypothetical protein